MKKTIYPLILSILLSGFYGWLYTQNSEQANVELLQYYRFFYPFIASVGLALLAIPHLEQIPDFMQWAKVIASIVGMGAGGVAIADLIIGNTANVLAYQHLSYTVLWDIPLIVWGGTGLIELVRIIINK